MASILAGFTRCELSLGEIARICQDLSNKRGTDYETLINNLTSAINAMSSCAAQATIIEDRLQTACPEAQDLTDLLQKAIDTFNVSKNSSGMSIFLNLRLIPHPTRGKTNSFSLEGDLRKAATRIQDITSDLENAYKRLHKRVESEASLQHNIAKYKIVLRAICLAFKKEPFNISENLMKEEIKLLYTEAQLLETPARSSLFDEMGQVTVPEPFRDISVNEYDIYSPKGLNGEQPQLELDILLHHLFARFTTGAPPAPMHYIFQLLANNGTAWVENSLEESTINRVLSRICPQKFTNLQPHLVGMDESREDWVPSNEAVRSVLKALGDESYKVLKKASKPCHRIAVIGATSHGKSSFINALIGEQFIAVSGLATTGWPLVIQHDSSCKVPTLEIQPDHFKAYIDAIARFRPSDYMAPIEEAIKHTQDTGIEHSLGIEKMELHRRWATLKKDRRTFNQELAEYESGSYAFPVETFDLQQINDTILHSEIVKIGRIGTLIRLCYLFGLRGLENDAIWPKLTVAMSNIPESLKTSTLELIDLPGYGETVIKKGDVKAQWEQIIGTVDGVVLVFKTEGKLLSDPNYSAHEHSFLSRLKECLDRDKKPVIAIGTYGDDIHAQNFNEGLIAILFSVIWPHVSEKVINNRVTKVSNVEWISAEIVSKRMQGPDGLNYGKLAEGIGALTMNLLPIHRKSEAQGSAIDRKALEEHIKSMKKSSGFPNALNLIKLLDFSNAGITFISSIQGLLQVFRKVDELYQNLITSSLKTREDLEAADVQHEELRETIANFTLIWFYKKGQFSQDQQTKVDDFAHKARKKVIEHLKMFLQEGLEALEVTEDNGSLSLTKGQITSLCSRVGQNLDDLLDHVQTGMVNTVRELIVTAWEQRIKELVGTFDLAQLCGQGSGSESDVFKERVCHGIQDAVKEHFHSKVPIDKQLLRLINSCLPAGPAQPTKQNGRAFFGARSKAENRYIHRMEDSVPSSSDLIEILTGFSVKQSHSEDTGGNKKYIPVVEKRQLDSNTSPQDLASHIYNIVGIMGRSPVLASANTLKNAFSMVKDVFKDKITVSKTDLLQRFAEKLIDPWHRIVLQEWRDSLQGAIDLCASIGMTSVWEIMDLKKSTIKKSLDNHGNPLCPDSLKSLIIAQANCSAYISALETLEKICRDDKLKYYDPATSMKGSCHAYKEYFIGL
ncbi:hypothetical protein FRC17_003575 [Serendipita sp. 399]|nr:hypothetical protein FRC17_003575 [Serendipita sp. 399]